jgi:hypothetical protein
MKVEEAKGEDLYGWYESHITLYHNMMKNILYRPHLVG